MPCAACGHDNRAHAKFCEECGAALAPAAATPQPRAYTPRHLAERILTSRTALQGERKPVTVLFADVQGSMALAEALDAEEWHAIMNQFFGILADGVHRFEGTVNQYTGDGIMALFGAPLAHEDHAQRAAHAALHLTGALREYAQTLRRASGLQFSVRMGLNSGEVVVGAIGDDLRMDYTAQGHTVGLAARMEHLCEPGRVYLTQATANLLTGYFELEDLGAFTIKGVRQPVRVHALLGAGPLRSRFDAARARGLSRFVGRAAELAALENISSSAAAAGGVVIAIAAPPGVGKSRLCAEFAERCHARGAAVVHVQALAHGATLPLLPVQSLFRQLLGVDERDGAEAARQKIAGGLLLLDDAFKASLPALFDLLGVSDPMRAAAAADPDVRLRMLIDAARALLCARGRPQRAILVVEDLHWLDPASDVFLRRLTAVLADTPVMVVLNFRPEYDDAWLQPIAAGRLALQPLSEAAAGELLEALLGPDPSVRDLAERLRVRAGGNPFFAEEMVQSLVQDGSLTGLNGAYRLLRRVDEAAIPATVHALLAARIDRLAPRDKQVLQTAAVIGKEFDEPVLRAVTGLAASELAAALSALAAAELVFAHAMSGVAEYAFKHPLTQEVAYATQLASRRAGLHAATARALDPHSPQPTAARAVLLAYHWERAGSAWEAAEWQHHAARALMGRDTADAVARLFRVLELLGETPEPGAAVELAIQTRDDLLRSGNLSTIAPDTARRLFATGRALAESSDNRGLLVRLLATYGEYLFFTGRGAEAPAYLREANELARGSETADAVRISVVMDNAQTALWVGRPNEALQHIARAEQILARGGSGGSEIPVGLWGDAFTFAVRGLALTYLGQWREGASDLDRAVRLADVSSSLEGRCVARQFVAMGGLLSGAMSLAVPNAQAAGELAAQSGNAFLQNLAQACTGSVLAACGRVEEALPMLTALVDDAHPGSMIGAFEWSLLPALSDAQRTAGDSAAALVTARRAVELGRSNDALTVECAAQLALAAALVAVEATAGRGAIEAALARAASLIEQTGAEIFRPRLHAVRAQHARAVGDADGACRELREAERLCRAMGMDELADLAARELAGAGT